LQPFNRGIRGALDERFSGIEKDEKDIGKKLFEKSFSKSCGV